MAVLERPLALSLLAARVKSTTAVATAIAVLTLAHALYYAPRVVDDLFISLRYAENLAHGRGLVFNVGERVEGFSSPLWVLLQAVGLRLGVEGVLFTKLLGLGSLVALHFALHRFVRELFGVDGVLALLPNAFLGFNSFFLAWSGLGLETPLVSALILASFVLVRRHVEGHARRRSALAALVGLATVRPEGPLWVAVVLGCELAATPFGARARLRAWAALALGVALAGGALLLARRGYYGAFLPNTYLVKGADAARDLARLAPLYGQGSAPIERFVFLGGAVLLAVAAVRRARLAGIAIALTTMAFTVHVEKDWMPGLRHLLPLTVVAPVGFAWAAHELLRRRHLLATLAAVGLVTCVGSAALVVARVDARNVQDPFADGRWNKRKSLSLWSDTWAALRRREPAHVAAMDAFQMGMITQNYRLLEASADPLPDSWYVGRDIGKVGYYVDARVFDTAGLFTPAVVRDASWRVFRRPSGPLLDAVVRLRPVALELYEQWPIEFAREPSRLSGLSVTAGSLAVPVDLERQGAGPEPEEILRRYERSLAKFPRAFYLATLYGESVGAAMEKRTRIVRAVVDDLRAMGEPPSDALGAGVVLGNEVTSRGCTLVAPSVVRPGAEVVVRCWLDVNKATLQPWTLFVHFVDAGGRRVFSADHTPGGGLTPSTKWRDGQRVRDAHRFTVPSVPAGDYQMIFGLYGNGTRASTSGPGSTIDQAIRGPTLHVSSP
ncbi:MAG: hypothetical protein IPJ34_11560 [Myxococcales bacterium]|nr:hypothetical protein [Myxococcales bacterium]